MIRLLLGAEEPTQRNWYVAEVDELKLLEWVSTIPHP